MEKTTKSTTMQRLLSTAVKAERQPRRRTLSRALLLLPLTALLAAALTGCSKPEVFVEGPCEISDGGRSLKVYQNTFRCDGRGDEWAFYVEAHGGVTWRLEDLPEWVTADVTEYTDGKDDSYTDLVLTVAEYRTSNADPDSRTADIRLRSTAKGWDGSITLRVMQERYKEVEGISLDSSDVTVRIVDKQIIRATVYPSDAYDRYDVRWTSTDEGIATVKGGVITPVDEGECQVIAECNGHRDTCDVKVWMKHVNSITLDSTSVYLDQGWLDSRYIHYTADIPADADFPEVTWENSDPTVATFDKNTGLIEAWHYGTTVISAVTDGGRMAARCTVTVKKIPLVEMVGPCSPVYMYGSDTAELRSGSKMGMYGTLYCFKPLRTTERHVTYTADDPSLVSFSLDSYNYAKDNGATWSKELEGWPYSVWDLIIGHVESWSWSYRYTTVTITSETGLQVRVVCKIR